MKSKRKEGFVLPPAHFGIYLLQAALLPYTPLENRWLTTRGHQEGEKNGT